MSILELDIISSLNKLNQGNIFSIANQIYDTGLYVLDDKLKKLIIEGYISYFQRAYFNITNINYLGDKVYYLTFKGKWTAFINK